MGIEQDQEKVLAVWPTAEARHYVGDEWVVVVPLGPCISERIGEGDTEADAWNFAVHQARKEARRRARERAAR